MWWRYEANDGAKCQCQSRCGFFRVDDPAWNDPDGGGEGKGGQRTAPTTKRWRPRRSECIEWQIDDRSVVHWSD